jgi:propionyl-CoA synthetase
LSTAEVENVLSAHDEVVEAAVVGIDDEIKGEKPFAFVILKGSKDPAVTGRASSEG